MLTWKWRLTHLNMGLLNLLKNLLIRTRLLNFIKRAVENLNLKSQNKDYENKLFYSYEFNWRTVRILSNYKRSN